MLANISTSKEYTLVRTLDHASKKLHCRYGNANGKWVMDDELLRLAILMKEMFLHWHDWAHRCRRNDEAMG
jgi:hypothetical protein